VECKRGDCSQNGRNNQKSKFFERLSSQVARVLSNACRAVWIRRSACSASHSSAFAACSSSPSFRKTSRQWARSASKLTGAAFHLVFVLPARMRLL
jgi:hypothetical protein